MWKRILATLAALGTAAATLSACAHGPTDRRAVCTAFDDLGTQVLVSSGLFDNLVFLQADDLSDLAGRYPGSPDLAGDAAALHRIAGSDSTSGSELSNATTDIAELCGHPLGVGTTYYGYGDAAHGQPSTTAQPPVRSSTPRSATTTTTTSARDLLETQRAADEASVEQLTGRWVPQLSSKAYSASYGYDAIWLDHESLRQRHPGALLLWSGDYSTFSLTGYWVTVVAAPSGTAAGANRWCDEQGIGPDDCFAKLLSHTAGPQKATVHR